MTPCCANSHMSVPLRVLTVRTSLHTYMCSQVYIYSITDTFVYEPMLCKLTYVCTLRVLTPRTSLYTYIYSCEFRNLLLPHTPSIVSCQGKAHSLCAFWLVAQGQFQRDRGKISSAAIGLVGRWRVDSFGIWLDRYTFLVLWTTLLERLYFGWTSTTFWWSRRTLNHSGGNRYQWRCDLRSNDTGSGA